MTNTKRNNSLRQWFGPMAQQLFQIASRHHKTELMPDGCKNILMNKQAAQSFLIEASFYHQKCMQQFQIADDIKAKRLEPTQELCELLLYIRMTNQHPSHETLHIHIDCHLPCALDFDRAIEYLITAKLVQKIEFLHFKFYDKNPYPHSHIFDHKNLTLKDHDNDELLFDHQKLINYLPNSGY